MIDEARHAAKSNPVPDHPVSPARRIVRDSMPYQQLRRRRKHPLLRGRLSLTGKSVAECTVCRVDMRSGQQIGLRRVDRRFLSGALTRCVAQCRAGKVFFKRHRIGIRRNRRPPEAEVAQNCPCHADHADNASKNENFPTRHYALASKTRCTCVATLWIALAAGKWHGPRGPRERAWRPRPLSRLADS
jgi:hypothetical protein